MKTAMNLKFHIDYLFTAQNYATDCIF